MWANEEGVKRTGERGFRVGLLSLRPVGYQLGKISVQTSSVVPKLTPPCSPGLAAGLVPSPAARALHLCSPWWEW